MAVGEELGGMERVRPVGELGARMQEDRDETGTFAADLVDGDQELVALEVRTRGVRRHQPNDDLRGPEVPGQLSVPVVAGTQHHLVESNRQAGGVSASYRTRARVRSGDA